MNIFAGSRRIATVAAALWIVGWLIAAAAHETKVSARYDFIVGSNFANFAGFDLYSCPQNTYDRSLNNKFPRPKGRGIGILGTGEGTPRGAGNLPAVIQIRLNIGALLTKSIAAESEMSRRVKIRNTCPQSLRSLPWPREGRLRGPPAELAQVPVFG